MDWVSAHSHNGLPHMLEGLLHKLPHAVHLPRCYNKVIWLVLLQHHPHGLEETETEIAKVKTQIK